MRDAFGNLVIGFAKIISFALLRNNYSESNNINAAMG